MNPDHLDNEIFMHKFRSGYEPALKKVFDLFGASLFFFANNMIDNRQQAEDVVAISFTKLWRQRETFIELNNIKAYLYVVTRNACLDYLKHQKRKNFSHKELQYLLSENNNEVVNRIIYADLVKIIFKEIDSLPEMAKKVFRMTYIEGLKPDEIARRLNMPTQNVRNNKNRAVELLRLTLHKKNIPVSFVMMIAVWMQLAF